VKRVTRRRVTINPLYRQSLNKLDSIAAPRRGKFAALRYECAQKRCGGGGPPREIAAGFLFSRAIVLVRGANRCLHHHG
jgi:hypothetical protein